MYVTQGCVECARPRGLSEDDEGDEEAFGGGWFADIRELFRD
jgi:hypothetical protein